MAYAASDTNATTICALPSPRTSTSGQRCRNSTRQGKVVAEHLGGLGSVDADLSIRERLAFWDKLLASTPWLQFNPLSLMNANKAVFGVNLGHMWGEVDRMRGWMDQLMDLREPGAIKPKIARTSVSTKRAPPIISFRTERTSVR